MRHGPSLLWLIEHSQTSSQSSPAHHLRPLSLHTSTPLCQRRHRCHHCRRHLSCQCLYCLPESWASPQPPAPPCKFNRKPSHSRLVTERFSHTSWLQQTIGHAPLSSILPTSASFSRPLYRVKALPLVLAFHPSRKAGRWPTRYQWFVGSSHLR